MLLPLVNNLMSLLQWRVADIARLKLFKYPNVRWTLYSPFADTVVCFETSHGAWCLHVSCPFASFCWHVDGVQTCTCCDWTTWHNRSSKHSFQSAWDGSGGHAYASWVSLPHVFYCISIQPRNVRTNIEIQVSFYMLVEVISFQQMVHSFCVRSSMQPKQHVNM